MIAYGTHLSLSDLLSMITSRSIHVAINGIISFSVADSYSMCVCMCVCVCVYHLFFNHLSVDGYLDCFHVLAIVNSAAMNIGVHASL